MGKLLADGWMGESLDRLNKRSTGDFRADTDAISHIALSTPLPMGGFSIEFHPLSGIIKPRKKPQCHLMVSCVPTWGTELANDSEN